MIEITDKDFVSLKLTENKIKINDLVGIIYKKEDGITLFTKGKIMGMDSSSIEFYERSLLYSIKDDNIIEKGSFEIDFMKMKGVESLNVYFNPVEFHKAMNSIIYPMNKKRRLHNEAIDEGEIEGEKEKLFEKYEEFLHKVIKFDATVFRK